MGKGETNKKIEEISQKIASNFEPEKIILFGSYAWGNPTPDSDVDLFVVKETDDTRRLAKKIDGSLWGRTFPLDILVYTPQAVERRIKLGDNFIGRIMQKGKILYERPKITISRMA